MQIGDGAIVAKTASGPLEVLTVPGDSEYINETTFITSSDALGQVHFNIRPEAKVSGIAALTDGMQFLALQYSDNTAHEPFFTPLFDYAAGADSSDSDLYAFLRSQQVCEKTDGDKTLAVAVRICT